MYTWPVHFYLTLAIEYGICRNDRPDLDGLDRIVHVVRGRGGGGQVVDLVHLQKQRVHWINTGVKGTVTFKGTDSMSQYIRSVSILFQGEYICG